MRTQERTTTQSAPQNLAGGALRTFFNLAEQWGLSSDDCQTLLATPQSTLHRWRAQPERARLNPDTLERLSYLFNIWSDLQIVLPREQAADSWIKRPNDNPMFGGRPPLERMRAGHVSDLYTVAQYTSAWRGMKS